MRRLRVIRSDKLYDCFVHVGTDHSDRSPVPAAPVLVWFGSDSSAGGSSAWASRGPPRCSPPSRLSGAVSLASPRSPSPRLETEQRGQELALKVGRVAASWWQRGEAERTRFSWTFCGCAECALGRFRGRRACGWKRTRETQKLTKDVQRGSSSLVLQAFAIDSLIIKLCC